MPPYRLPALEGPISSHRVRDERHHEHKDRDRDENERELSYARYE
jgi:hypothetical protein